MLSNISGYVKMHTLFPGTAAYLKVLPVSSCGCQAPWAGGVCPLPGRFKGAAFFENGAESGGLKGYKLRHFMSRKEAGIGVVEVILILLVLVGLVLIFKEQIVSLANSIFTNINSQVDEV